MKSIFSENTRYMFLQYVKLCSAEQYQIFPEIFIFLFLQMHKKILIFENVKKNYTVREKNCMCCDIYRRETLFDSLTPVNILCGKRFMSFDYIFSIHNYTRIVFRKLRIIIFWLLSP